jgi:hypothetical protein
MITKVCGSCKSEFQVKASRRDSARYCGRECQYMARRTALIVGSDKRPTARQCTGCLAVKPLVAFYPRKPNGTHSRCRSCMLRAYRERYATSEEARAYQHDYYLANKEELRVKRRKYKYPSSNKWARKVRLDAIRAYGGFCQCCGETELQFLAIDHIYGGGTLHRKTIGKQMIFSWLRKNGYPEGFQVLCHSCNLAKGFYGECPHLKYKLIDLAMARRL